MDNGNGFTLYKRRCVLVREFKTRVCVKCEKRKSIDEFDDSKTIGYYKKGTCLKCLKAKRRELGRNYYCNNLKKIRDRCKDYYNNNKKKVISKTLAYQKRNPEKVREWSRNWRKNNLEKAIESVRSYNKDISNNLKPSYVIRSLTRLLDLKPAYIKQYPALIAAKREQIRSVRLCKSLQKNKTKPQTIKQKNQPRQHRSKT